MPKTKNPVLKELIKELEKIAHQHEWAEHYRLVKRSSIWIEYKEERERLSIELGRMAGYYKKALEKAYKQLPQVE